MLSKRRVYLADFFFFFLAGVEDALSVSFAADLGVLGLS